MPIKRAPYGHGPRRIEPDDDVRPVYQAVGPAVIHPFGDPIVGRQFGLNVANCTFQIAIETVRVTITHTVSGATHTQVFSLQKRR